MAPHSVRTSAAQIPAVSGLQHHVRVLACLGELSRQRHRVVVDADRLQRLTLGAAAHDQLPASMEVNAYCRCCSTGFSFRRLRVGWGTPSVLRAPGSRRREETQRSPVSSATTFDLGTPLFLRVRRTTRTHHRARHAGAALRSSMALWGLCWRGSIALATGSERHRHHDVRPGRHTPILIR